MKKYRVEVVATKKVVITEEMWVDEDGIGELDEFQAAQFAKGMLIEELRNDPNRGSVKVERIE